MQYVLGGLALLCLAFMLAVGFYTTAPIWLSALLVSTMLITLDVVARKKRLRQPETASQLSGFVFEEGSGIAYGADYARLDRYWQPSYVSALFVTAYLAITILGLTVISKFHLSKSPDSEVGQFVLYTFLLVPAGAVYWIGPLVYRIGSRSIQKELDGLVKAEGFLSPEIDEVMLEIDRLCASDEYWGTSFGQHASRSLTNRSERKSRSRNANRAQGTDIKAVTAMARALADTLALAEHAHRRCLATLLDMQHLDLYWGSRHADHLGSRLDAIRNRMPTLQVEEIGLAREELDRVWRDTEQTSAVLFSLTEEHHSLTAATNDLNADVIASGRNLWMIELEQIHSDLEPSHFRQAIDALDRGAVEDMLANLSDRIAKLDRALGGDGEPPHEEPSRRKKRTQEPAAGKTGSQTLADAWKTMNLLDTTSFDVAQAVYRVLCKNFHPDVSPEEGEKFQRITEAWELIKAHFGK